MPYIEYRRDVAVAVCIVLFLSGILAFTYQIYYGLDYFWTFIFITAGPFAGWILAAEYGSSGNSLFLLIPTFLSLWTVVRALRSVTVVIRRRRLVLAATIWLLSGLFYLLLVLV